MNLSNIEQTPTYPNGERYLLHGQNSVAGGESWLQQF